MHKLKHLQPSPSAPIFCGTSFYRPRCPVLLLEVQAVTTSRPTTRNAKDRRRQTWNLLRPSLKTSPGTLLWGLPQTVRVVLIRFRDKHRENYIRGEKFTFSKLFWKTLQGPPSSDQRAGEGSRFMFSTGHVRQHCVGVIRQYIIIKKYLPHNQWANVNLIRSGGFLGHCEFDVFNLILKHLSSPTNNQFHGFNPFLLTSFPFADKMILIEENHQLIIQRSLFALAPHLPWYLQNFVHSVN